MASRETRKQDHLERISNTTRRPSPRVGRDRFCVSVHAYFTIVPPSGGNQGLTDVHMIDIGTIVGKL